MSDISEFNQLIENLSLTVEEFFDTELLQTKFIFISGFNKRNENKFKFVLLENEIKQKFTGNLCNSLEISLKCLNEIKSNLQPKFVSSILNLIRILSRDSELIGVFNNNLLLADLQYVANFSDKNFLETCARVENEEKSRISSQSTENETLNVNALKAISNLIYNSTFIQQYYGESAVAESIARHLKQFNPSTYSLITSDSTLLPEDNHKFNIMIFNLRILFLLSIFNKSLRHKLKEQFEVVTYLIEIIDQIMKERLNLNYDETSLAANNWTNEQSEFCFLKSIDIDYINEALKVLFNLTMDISSVKQNAASTMGENSNLSQFHNQESNKFFENYLSNDRVNVE
jgi:hypothetical protein